MCAAISSIKQATTQAVEKAIELTHKVLPPIVQYVVDHPIRAAGHTTSAAALIAPAIVTAPIMAITGFTGRGVAAGSIAAGFQSTIGNVAAESVFATLQSAAMGGSGAVAVAGVVRGAALAAEGANALRNSA